MFNKKYDFIAIDCEKASNEPTSLCSIGIACFKNGKIQNSKEYIIKPVPFIFYKGSIIDDKYHDVPIKIYENSPSIAEIWPKLKKLFYNELLVGHGINGDLQAIQIALGHFGIDYTTPSQNECICTNIASIYTYPELESHKLKTLCEHLLIDIDPHHALSDAQAAGFLLLDMLNITDCKSAKDFISICLEYNQIITTKYTDKNIEKYENKILSIFNNNEQEINVTFKTREILTNDILNYYKNFYPCNILPSIKIVQCLSPIIYIYKSKEYSNYINELNTLNPFTHDNFFYLKTNKNEYVLFIGLLIDKNDLIFNLFLFLSRVTIEMHKNNFYGVSLKNILKYKETTTILSYYMFDVLKFEEREIFEYIEFLFKEELHDIMSYDFRKKYNSINQRENTIQSIELFKDTMCKTCKLLGIFIGLKENFKVLSENIVLPEIFIGNSSLLEDIIDIVLFNNKTIYNEIEYIIRQWYYENINKIYI